MNVALCARWICGCANTGTIKRIRTSGLDTKVYLTNSHMYSFD